MGDSGESDYGSSKKKRKQTVKKHKPERKEEKMLKPRLQAPVKGKVGHPTASQASKEEVSFPRKMTRNWKAPRKEKCRPLRSLGRKGLKTKPRLGRSKIDGGLGRDFIFIKEGEKKE